MFGREGNDIINEKKGFSGGREGGEVGSVGVLRARLMDPSG